MKQFMKKVLTMALSAMMLVVFIPTSAFAAGGSVPAGSRAEEPGGGSDGKQDDYR